MCTEVNVVRDGEVTECETVGQLARALRIAIDAVPIIGDFTPEADDCLCGVRWNALPARRATDEEGWPFPGYIIEPPNTELSGAAAKD